MSGQRISRRILAAAAATSIIGMGALAACGTKDGTRDKEGPPPAPSTSMTMATVSPTEKSVSGAKGPGQHNGASFAPSITARPAPTALPGNVNTSR